MEKANQGRSDALLIKEFLSLCADKWLLFVISLVVCLGVGCLKVLQTPKVYSRSATVLIKETYARRQSNDLESMLSAGGISQMSSKLANEIVAFKSPDIMYTVAERLELDVNYSQKGMFHDNVLYGAALPVKVKFLDVTSGVNFVVEPVGDKFVVKEMSGSINGESVQIKDIYEFNLGDTISTAFGKMTIAQNPICKEPLKSPIKVSKSSLKAVSQSYSSRLQANAVDLKNYSDVLELSISDQSIRRAEDVLNCVIAVYNENWVEDRNKMAVSTSLFINDRLNSIEKELWSVDNDISSFKSKNLLPDVSAVSGIYLNETTDINKRSQTLETQLSIVKFLKNYLVTTTAANQMIPYSQMSTNTSVNTQIAAFNELVLERNNIVANSSEKNPIAIDMDAQMQTMKQTLIKTVDNEISALNAQAATLSKEASDMKTRIADNPNQAKYLLTVERQQKVKESLYLFLLQKREENELSQAFTAYNTRVITYPTGSNSPISPNTRNILLIALVLGLFIPVGYIYLRIILDTKVRGKSDIANVTIPFIGEIPQFHHEGEKFVGFLNRHAEQRDAIVVAQGKRNSINEAFRVMRTNLEFLCKGKTTVLAVTSFNPGSGKTFCTMNLAAVLSIKGSKVLVIDGDLRHASLSTYVGNPHKGITNYIQGGVKDLKSLIVHPEASPLVDVLPVGTIPPNPSELVSSPEFASIIDSLKSEYDYVFVDCPPVDIVADAQILQSYVDRTVFIIRAGLLEKVMLPELENLFTEKKYKNMALVLNGTERDSSYIYGSYRGYGYHGRYGYYGNKSYYSEK